MANSLSRTGIRELFGVGRGDNRNLKQWPPAKTPLVGYPPSLPIPGSFGLWLGFRLQGQNSLATQIAALVLGKTAPTVGTLGFFVSSSGYMQVKLNGAQILQSNFPIVDPGSSETQTQGYDTTVYVSGTGANGLNSGDYLITATTYVNAKGETTASFEYGQVVYVYNNSYAQIPSPLGPIPYGTESTAANATGWNLYASTAPNPMTLQNSTPIALGTDFNITLESVTTSGQQLPTTNSAAEILPATPSTGTFTATTTSGGTLAARTYYYCIAYQQANGDTTAATAIQSINIPANELFQVNFSQDSNGINASYVVVYAGTTNNPADLSAQTSQLPITAASWTEPTTGLVSNAEHPPSTSTITTEVPQAPSPLAINVLSSAYISVAIYTDRKDGNGPVQNGFIQYPINTVGADGSLQSFIVNESTPAGNWAVYFQDPQNLSRFVVGTNPQNQPPTQAYSAPARCSPAAMPQTILRQPPGTPAAAPIGTPTACSLVDPNAEYPIIRINCATTVVVETFILVTSVVLDYYFDPANSTWVLLQGPVLLPGDTRMFAFPASLACVGETWQVASAGSEWLYSIGGQCAVEMTTPSQSPIVTSENIPNIDGVLGQGFSEAVFLADVRIPYNNPNPTYTNVPVIARAEVGGCR